MGCPLRTRISQPSPRGQTEFRYCGVRRPPSTRLLRHRGSFGSSTWAAGLAWRSPRCAGCWSDWWRSGSPPSTRRAGSASVNGCSGSVAPTTRASRCSSGRRWTGWHARRAKRWISRCCAAGRCCSSIRSTHRLRAVSAVGVRFPLESTANGKAAQQLLTDPTASLSGIAFDRDEHTVGISAAGIAARTASGHIVAISVPAPSDRFTENETRIVEALRACAPTLVS
jgi:hypothetical protein